MAEKADVVQLSFAFAVKIIKLVNEFPKTTAGFELGRQLLRAGTSIGANVEEAQGARTKAEFINSMNIAKREGRETRFWLRALAASGLLKDHVASPLIDEVERLIRILTAIVKTSEQRRGRPSIIYHPSSSIT
jgi:four helix bundle protein